jgi:hypothetical protein
MELVVHQEREAALVARLSTLPVAMVQLLLHVGQHQTGAAAVAAAHQLLVRLQ